MERITYFNYGGFYINVDKLVEHEDSLDYFDNTMDMADEMDNISYAIGDKGVRCTLHELCNIDEDLIYNIARLDGLVYLGNLIDHIYEGGYSGE